MNAVDTNILIYVNDPRDRAKQAVAASLISTLTNRSITMREIKQAKK